MILTGGSFWRKHSCFCSARLIFQNGAERQTLSIAELIEKVPSESTLAELKGDETFLKFVDDFNERVEAYKSGAVSFGDLVIGVSPDDIAEFFKYNSALRICAGMFENLKRYPDDIRPDHDFMLLNHDRLGKFQQNMNFFLEERARFERKDLSQTEAQELSESGPGFEVHLYELDSKLEGVFRGAVERETAMVERRIDSLFPELMSVGDQPLRASKAKSLKGYQVENAKLKNDALQLLGPGKNFNLIESLGDFLAKSEVLHKKISELDDDNVGPGIYDSDFTEIFRINDELDARNYLIKGTVARLNAIFAKWDRFYQAPGRRKDSRYEELQAFRETFDGLKKKWLDPEGGDLTDSEYQVHYSVKDILAGAAEVVKGRYSAEYLFDGYPLGTVAQEFVEKDVAEDGKSVKLSQLLQSFAFHEKFVLQSLLIKGNEEFAGLELELFKAGFSESLPYVVRSADYNVESSSGFNAENSLMISVVKRMEYLYPLFRKDAVKNKKMIRKYLQQRIFSAVWGEYDDASETHKRGPVYFEGFLEHFSKYDLSTVKNGEAHKAKIMGLKARIDERNRYWFDAQAGVFGDNSRFNAPEDGLYFAMAAMDEYSSVMNEFHDEYQSLISDGYDIEKPLIKGEDGEATSFSLSAYGTHFDYLNSHHREIFNLVFPQVAPRLAAPPTPGQ